MNKWLVMAGLLSIAAAIAHVAVIFGGPDWYRFFGAGEGMAQAAERGSLRPALITLCIAAILLGWAAYAFSGSGLIPRLPLIKPALILISAILLARALAPAAILLFAPGRMSPFVLWSSAIVLILGMAYAVGTWIAWPFLGSHR
ncbi:MAG: hypothetical protein H0W74_07650 [Sphingosinicella sp.]|nr:hypothetical protein [Sphingosinicella sp.]